MTQPQTVQDVYAPIFHNFIAWEKSSRDTIDFKKIYVDMADDLVAGLALSEIVYWYLPNKDGDTKLRVIHDDRYWIACKRKEWHDRVRMTARQVDRALSILQDRGLIEKKTYKFKGTPVIHIRLILETFLTLWNRFRNDDTYIRLYETVKSPRKPSLPDGEVQIADSASLLTEITSKTLSTESLKEKDSSPQSVEQPAPEIQSITAPSHSHAPQPDEQVEITIVEETTAEALQSAGTTPLTPTPPAPPLPVAVPDEPEQGKQKRSRKAKPEAPEPTPEELAQREADKAAYEDARLGVCIAWQKRPLELDQRGHMWVSLYANFLTGRVSDSKKGTDYDKLKITPGMTAAEIAGFRMWYLEQEQFKDQTEPPTTLATLESRVGQFFTSPKLKVYAERGQREIDILKDAIARKKARDAEIAVVVVKPDEIPATPVMTPEEIKALIRGTARALSGKATEQEAA